MGFAAPGLSGAGQVVSNAATQAAAAAAPAAGALPNGMAAGGTTASAAPGSLTAAAPGTYSSTFANGAAPGLMSSTPASIGASPGVSFGSTPAMLSGPAAAPGLLAPATTTGAQVVGSTAANPSFWNSMAGGGLVAGVGSGLVGMAGSDSQAKTMAAERADVAKNYAGVGTGLMTGTSADRRVTSNPVSMGGAAAITPTKQIGGGDGYNYQYVFDQGSGQIIKVPVQ